MAQTYVYRYQVKGASTVQTGGVDTTPDAFAVAAATNVASGAVVTSAPITLTGFQANSAAAVSGAGAPQFSTDGGATWVTAGTISPNQTVLLRLTADSAPNTSRTATFSVGGVSSTWTVTTAPGDTVPNAFVLADVAGAAPSTVTTAAAVTPAGYDAPTAIGVSGDGSAQLSVAGGAWGTSGTIAPGQSFQVRATSSASFGAAVNVTVTVGGVSDTWTVTTRAVDTTPDAFAFQAQSNVATGTNPVSNEIVVAGLEAPAAFTVTSAASSYGLIVNGARGSVTSGTVSNGDRIKAVVAASTEPSTTTTATVTIGGVSGTFSVTTEPPDSTPDPFTIAAVTGATGNTSWYSPAFIPTGMNTSTTASVTGAGSPRLMLGGSLAASGTLARNGSTQLALTLGAEDGTAYTGTVTIGGVSAPYSVRVKDTVPNAYAVAALTEQELGARVTSAAVTPTGYDSPATIAVAGDGSPQISVAGGAYATSATISPGQSFTVQMTTSASNATASTATVTVGGVTATFTATTKEAASAASCPGQAEFYGYGRFCQAIPAGCNSSLTYTIGSGGQIGGGGAGGQTICVDVTPNGAGACYNMGMNWCTGNTNIYLRMNWN